MASISTDQNGNRAVQFVASDGKRRTVRLGKVAKRVAEEIKLRIEHLAAAQRSGISVDGETAGWLSKIGDDLADKLAAVGLAPRRQPTQPAARCPTLAEFVNEFLANRPHWKPTTRKTFDQTRDALLAFFPAERLLTTLTPGDGDDWKIFLQGQGYAPASIGTFIKRAKQMFRYAARKDIIARSPFGDTTAPTQVNKSREAFVTGEMTLRVLDACPDAEWRLLVALARYAGLRVPSEIVGLCWGHVDWENSRLTILSPKTEHINGRESRVIPIFPELRPYLEDLWDQTEPGTMHIINRYRDATQNLRTQLLRIIRKAGLQPWERLWQNLRSSRETELSESFPLHVVTAWIGNTEKVASKHYLQVTSAHFDKAVQRAADSGAVAVQIPVQQAAATIRTNPQDSEISRENMGFCGGLLTGASLCGVERYPRQESNL